MGLKVVAAALTITLVVLAILPAVFFLHPSIATHYGQARFHTFNHNNTYHITPIRESSHALASPPATAATQSTPRKIGAHDASVVKPGLIRVKPKAPVSPSHAAVPVDDSDKPAQSHKLALPINPTKGANSTKAGTAPASTASEFGETHLTARSKHEKINKNQWLYQHSNILEESLVETPDPAENPGRPPSGPVTMLQNTKAVFTSAAGGSIVDETSERVDGKLGGDGLPIDFNWATYLAMNPDLPEGGILSETQAVEHFKTLGLKEHRVYRSRFSKQQNHRRLAMQ